MRNEASWVSAIKRLGSSIWLLAKNRIMLTYTPSERKLYFVFFFLIEQQTERQEKIKRQNQAQYSVSLPSITLAKRTREKETQFEK